MAKLGDFVLKCLNCNCILPSDKVKKGIDFCSKACETKYLRKVNIKY